MKKKCAGNCGRVVDKPNANPIETDLSHITVANIGKRLITKFFCESEICRSKINKAHLSFLKYYNKKQEEHRGYIRNLKQSLHLK